MTDNEIIKALECCTSSCREIKCNSCLAFVDCRCMLKPKMLLDLINRQKAEIEKLATQNSKLKNRFTIEFDYDELKKIDQKVVDGIVIDIKQAKSEAVKDFVEKLKTKLSSLEANSPDTVYKTAMEDMKDYFVPKAIDNLVKEMVGEAEC